VPFVPISSYNNLCFLSEDFEKFDPKTHASYVLFRDIVVTSDSKLLIREEYKKLMNNKKENVSQELNESTLLNSYAQELVEM